MERNVKNINRGEPGLSNYDRQLISIKSEPYDLYYNEGRLCNHKKTCDNYAGLSRDEKEQFENVARHDFDDSKRNCEDNRLCSPSGGACSDSIEPCDIDTQVTTENLFTFSDYEAQSAKEVHVKHCVSDTYKQNGLQKQIEAHIGDKSHAGLRREGKFILLKSLLSGTGSHTLETQYKCDVCEERFDQQNSLQKHKETHMSDEKIPCHNGKEAVLTTNILEHIKIQNTEHISDIIVPKNNMNEDEEWHMSDEELPSDGIGAIFTTNVPEHIKMQKTEHNRDIIPPEINMEEEVLQISDKKTPPRDEIKAVLKTKVAEHIKMQNTEHTPDIIPPKNNMNDDKDVEPTNLPSSIKKQNKSHTGKRKIKVGRIRKRRHKKPFSCPVSGTELTPSSSLPKKIKVIIDVDDNQFLCEICNKPFPTYTKLCLHIKLHDNSFQCVVCNEVFKDKNELYKHHDEHVEKPYTCGVCSLAYVTTESLQRHMIKHTEDDQ